MPRSPVTGSTWITLAALLATCGGSPFQDAEPVPGDPAADSAQPAQAPADPPARTDSLRPLGGGDALLAPVAHIADERIGECSGIAFAGGWWWTHNDSGDGPFLYRSRSTSFEAAERCPVPGAAAIDWEELTVLDGDLLVCDVGDNLRARPTVTLYRVRPTAEGLERIATYWVSYPDGKHDAEGVWVADGRVHIVLKNRGEDAHWIYRLDELRDGQVNTPTRIGAVTIPEGEQVTAADASSDGHVALLTYSQLLVWPADAVAGAPAHAFTLHARQCEALAWDAQGIVFTNEQRDVFAVDDLLACGMTRWLPVTDRVRVARTTRERAAAQPAGALPVHALREGESVRMGIVDDSIVLDARFLPDTALVPSEGRLGSSLLLAFGTEPRLRATADDARFAVVLAPAENLGAVPLAMGAAPPTCDVSRIVVRGTATDDGVALHVAIPVAAVFPGGLPPRFRMALVGNGLRAGDDEPRFGALDPFSLLRPHVWAVVDVD